MAALNKELDPRFAKATGAVVWSSRLIVALICDGF